MKPITAALVLLLLWGAGCASEGAGKVPLRDESELPPPMVKRDAYETFSSLAPFEEQRGARFFEPDQAPRAPTVTLRTGDGRTELEPGSRGYVTIIVFWSAQDLRGILALQHVNDLARKYRRYRVRGVSIAARTKGVENAQRIAESRGVDLPLYYDDLDMSALRKLAGAADAEEPTAIPTIFIVDGNRKLRLYRPGFSFILQARRATGPQRPRLLEDAPPDKAIEDHLRKVLQERYQLR